MANSDGPVGRCVTREPRHRALVCTASLDLGVDWGDIDLVVQMGTPKGSSRLQCPETRVQ